MTAPGRRFADCKCGHTKENHDTPGFDGQCTANGCACLTYRPNLLGTTGHLAQAPVRPATVREPEITARGERSTTLEQLLQVGKRSSAKRTVALTEKIALLLHDLRGRLADERQAEEAAARTALEQEQARAEVERLAAQLAAAKAKLKARPRIAASTPTKDAAPRAVGSFPCPDCSYVSTTAQGRAAHRRFNHGYKAAS